MESVVHFDAVLVGEFEQGSAVLRARCRRAGDPSLHGLARDAERSRQRRLSSDRSEQRIPRAVGRRLGSWPGVTSDISVHRPRETQVCLLADVVLDGYTRRSAEPICEEEPGADVGITHDSPRGSRPRPRRTPCGSRRGPRRSGPPHHRRQMPGSGRSSGAFARRSRQQGWCRRNCGCGWWYS